MANWAENMTPFPMPPSHPAYPDFRTTRGSGAIQPHDHRRAPSGHFHRRIRQAYRDRVQPIVTAPPQPPQTEECIPQAWECKASVVAEVARRVRPALPVAGRVSVPRMYIQTTLARRAL